MVIGKIMYRQRFDDVTAYVLGKPEATFLGSNMESRSITELIREFSLSQSLTEIKYPVAHFSLALDPSENLSDSDFLRLAEAYLEGMDFDLSANQFFVARPLDRGQWFPKG